MKVDVNAIAALAGKQPTEVIAAIDGFDKHALSARSLRLAKSMLRAIKNDCSLEAPIRASPDSLWRRLCTLRPEPKSIPTASAGTTSPIDARTPKVIRHVTGHCVTDPLEKLREAMENEAQQKLVPPSGPVKPWLGTPPRQTTAAHCEKCGEVAECVFSVGWRCQDCWGQIGTSSNSSKKSN